MTARHARLFPVHPRTGLPAIGFTSRGPIWPVAGGAPNDGAGGGSDGDPGGGEPDNGGGKPNDGGKPGDDGGKPESKTFTQTELERLIGERLARERSKYADYDSLREKAGKYDELEEQQKSETQKLIERAEKAEREAKGATTAMLRAKIAAAKGLSPALAARLRGETEEEITADADDLLESLPAKDKSGDEGEGGKGERGAPDMDQGRRGRGDKPTVQSGWDLYAQRHGKKQPA